MYAGRLAEGDVVPPEGGWYDDVGAPMWVEWRRCDEGDDGTPPLYPDGVGKLLRAPVESTGHSVVPDPLGIRRPRHSSTTRTPLS